MKKITLLLALMIGLIANAQTVFSDDFESDIIDDIFFTNWDSLDEDGDSEFWEVADMLDYATNNAPAHPMQSNAADSDSWEGTPFSPDNYLITKDPIDLTAATAATLTYTVGTYQTNGSFTADQYSIYMSTSNAVTDILNETPITTRTVGDDCPSDQADGSASAATITLDVPADYVGESVYLVFRHYNTTDENSVLIDDVSVDATLSVGDESFEGFVQYVDANNNLILRAQVAIDNVTISNIAGQQLINTNINNTSGSVSLANLSNGVYLATVNIEGQRRTFKIAR